MTAICFAICFMFFIDFLFVKSKAMEGITHCFEVTFVFKLSTVMDLHYIRVALSPSKLFAGLLLPVVVVRA